MPLICKGVPLQIKGIKYTLKHYTTKYSIFQEVAHVFIRGDNDYFYVFKMYTFTN